MLTLDSFILECLYFKHTALSLNTSSEDQECGSSPVLLTHGQQRIDESFSADESSFEPRSYNQTIEIPLSDLGTVSLPICCNPVITAILIHNTVLPAAQLGLYVQTFILPWASLEDGTTLSNLANGKD
jgi:hypothetical protein